LAGRYPQVHAAGLPMKEEEGGFPVRAPVAMPVDPRAKDPFAAFKAFLSGFEGRVLLAAETPGRRETLLESLGRHGLRPAMVSGWREFVEGDAPLALTVAPLEQGLVLEAPRL